jgi:hypothetical protein
MNETMWDLWESGDYASNAPNTRAIIQKATVKKYGPWRSLVFGQDQPHYEIPNLKTISIDRRHQTDAASLTLTFMNQVPIDVNTNLDLTHAGESPSSTAGPSVRTLKDLGQPGYYTFRRGVTTESRPRWGHDADPVWVDMLIPNRVIRTFQGWGTDGSLNAWNDTNLILTGTWLIDNVKYSASGLVTVSCRDASKLLIEQRLYPPIIPTKQYPLAFCADSTEETTQDLTQEPTTGADVGQHISSGWDSSVTPWYGYDGSVFGHKASHAFDGDASSYWLSVGNSGPNEAWSYEWIGADCRGEPVNQVHFKPRWGGYVCYVAVKEAGVWQGTNVVPYGAGSEPAYPNDSDKKYVKKVNVPQNEDWFNIALPRTYNAEEVRLIFTNLADSGLGTYTYRAAVYEMQVRSFTPASSETVPAETLIPGNISDYTDIVKILTSWSGFYWPYGTSDPLLRAWEEDLIAAGDPILDGTLSGRTWGDFAYSGAYPVEPPCIPGSFWDNKSVMDGVNQIKEILGFIFYIDATGGVVWRMPNIWRTGNFISGVGYVGSDSVREVNETKVLIDFGVTIDDTNLRSEIIVVSEADRTLHTAIQPGWSQGEVIPSAVDPLGDLALLGGQDRIMLVPNYPFISQEEVDKFAYLVSLWIHWSYRTTSFRIPGNPAFEPDDQIKIFERITEESYVHYVQGVGSVMDLDAGTWYLDVDTHWLGNGPDQTWVVNTFNDMPPALYSYLVAIGEIDPDGDPSKLPDGFDPEYQPPDFPIEYPRVEDDYSQLFPSLANIQYTYNDSSSDLEIALATGSTYVVDPTTTSPGTVEHRSEAWRFNYWGSPGTDLATIRFMYKWLSEYSTDAPPNTHSGQVNSVDTVVPRAAASAFVLLAELLADQSYNVYSCTAFAGINRKIATTGTLSAHAWGLAIDINPDINQVVYPKQSNSWSSWYALTNSPAMAAAAQNITQKIRTKTSGVRVFGWGGYWNTKFDPMHFEVIASRNQLLEGVEIV